RLTPRKALMFFTFALVGSLTGTLVGPRIVGAFDGSPVWLLPGILCVLILLALIVAHGISPCYEEQAAKALQTRRRGLTMRSSRNCIATPATWQKELAMWPATRCNSA